MWVPTNTVPAPMDYSQVTTLPYLLVQSRRGHQRSSRILTSWRVVFAADDSDDVSSHVMIMSENADAGGTTVWEGAETKARSPARN